jgi:mRNA interferase MazF
MVSASADPPVLQRGDVVLVADRQGEFTSKPRPAVVVQSPLFFATATLTVCLLTSIAVDAPLLRIALPAGAETGLALACWAAVDQLATVRRSHVRGPIGRLDPATLRELDQAMLLFLGFADHWAKANADDRPR